ncbi:malonyl CoA-acyl carrier protein transacylase [Streptomyces longisporoflavus]|uniref:ACP S-malonyltransferase n=1 Tax=Streptomyces longisporoflavus TaxID=28044 RepID=UPI0019C0182D|nr:ACP S-malonyltransferase [Streptomyces longisporoflavus]GGV72017.1 malonyl CoA-acyl carrier protein transacylase [Streptomyces longisporoflavus]
MSFTVPAPGALAREAAAGQAPAAEPPPTGSALAMFPGQGSQRPGMAKHLLARYPDSAGRVLRDAGRTLGVPLAEICVRGTAGELAQTEITQPAVLAVSLATYEALRQEHGFTPAAVAGHSLGEYTALVAAGVLTAEDAVRLVLRRGTLMAEVGKRVTGAMTAVVGLSSARVEALCEDGGIPGVAEVANYNEERQTVVSGELAAVTEVGRKAAEAGAERVVPLRVSAPFHCSLMREIEPEFAAALDDCAFADPRIAVLSSVTGTRVRTGAQARRLLRTQLAGPVRWLDVLHTARAEGLGPYVETGPGRVLSGFARRTLPEATVRSTNDARHINALVRAGTR